MMNDTKHGSLKQTISLFILLTLIFPLFCSCNIFGSQEKRKLWVVTEQTTWDRMNGQLYEVERAYEKAHSDVEIKVDYLPTEKQERDVFLQQLRTDILQGGGPDCYLLPTENRLILDVPTQYVYVDVEPLFPDVELAMRNGLFYDVSEFYDADETLEKESLNTTIMDAGVVGGKRYVLPLRYDIPVIYAQNDYLERVGLDLDVLNGDILSIMESVYETEAPFLAGGVLFDGLSMFSSLIDYNSGKSTPDAETLKSFLVNYQKLKSLLGEAYVDYDMTAPDAKSVVLAEKDRIFLEKLDIKKYIYCSYFDDIELAGSNIDINAPKTEYYPLWIGSMQDVLAYAPLAQYEQSELTVLPLRSVGDGCINATVTYYAAVGSGSKDPELAYDFLSQFLSEESQWEGNRPKRPYVRPIKDTAGNTSNDTHYPGLIESGWPVLDEDSLETLWNRRRKQFYVRDMERGATSEQQWRMRQIGLRELNDENIPLFDVTIDQVRFDNAISNEFSSILDQLNDTHSANAPTNADIEKLVNDFVENIRFHVLEG